MIQKAGTIDNTLGFNGWQSADHWFTANIDQNSNPLSSEMIWVNLEPQIIKHLSFTNYRVSVKRDGGKIHLGVLTGGVLSSRPDNSNKSSATISKPSGLSDELPELPFPISKPPVILSEAQELAVSKVDKEPNSVSKGASIVSTDSNSKPNLPDLPLPIQSSSSSNNTTTLPNSSLETKKRAPLLPIIGLILLILAIAGYLLTQRSTSSSKSDQIIPSSSPVDGKQVAPTAAPPAPAQSPPAAPPTQNSAAPKSPTNTPAKSASSGSDLPDLNKIVKDAVNK